MNQADADDVRPEQAAPKGRPIWRVRLLRGLRQFAFELAVVVLGVFIALEGQQWAENRALGERAADAEERIRSESLQNAANLLERLAIRQCLQQRLRRLADGLAGGATDWRAMIMQSGDEDRMVFARLYRMPTRLWLGDAYQGALTRGDLTSVEPDRRETMAEIYIQIGDVRRFNALEVELADELSALQFNPSLGAGQRTAMLAKLVRLDRLNGLIVGISRQTINSIQNDLGYQWTSEEIADRRRSNGWETYVDHMRDIYGDCVDPRAVNEFVLFSHFGRGRR